MIALRSRNTGSTVSSSFTAGLPGPARSPRQALRLVGLLGLALALGACGDDSSNAADGGGGAGSGGDDASMSDKDAGSKPDKDSGMQMMPGEKGNVTGRVFRADTFAPLANAIITGPDGRTAKTNAKGEFEIEMLETKRVALLANAKGYAQAVEPVTVLADATSSIEFRLLRVTASADVSVKNGGVVRAASGAEVTVDKAAFVGPDGKAVTGMVTVELTVLDPSTPEGLRSFPGDFAATTMGGTDGQLESFVPMEITVRQGDTVLDFADGKGADVSFPVPENLKDKAPQTIALWSLSETTGAWVEEGTATLVTDGDGQLVYRGRIQHMSWWNCDRFIDNVSCVRGCVTQNGKPPTRFVLTEAEGIDYQSSGMDSLGADGCFASDVKGGGQLRVRARSLDPQNPASTEWKVVTAPATHMSVKDGADKCFDIGTLELVGTTTANAGCPAGMTKCGDACVDLAADGDNCGKCGSSCGGALSGSVCVDSKCACKASEATCQVDGSSVCIDVSFDEDNCGKCGAKCGDGKSCESGKCVQTKCATGLTLCGDACVDTDDNVNDCGACGKSCGQGELCSAGTCKATACPSGMERCNGECVTNGECNPTPTGCTAEQFTCTGSTQCIALAKKCDEVTDCENGADEQNCVTPPAGCTNDQFTCDDQGCVDMSKTCDDSPDCGDGSDEADSLCATGPVACSDQQFACADDSCISKTLVCNKEDDCSQGEDETPAACGSECAQGSFACPNTSGNDLVCVVPSQGCDGTMDCPGGEDELNCSTCDDTELACKSGECVAKAKQCDTVDDCSDGSDEDGCSSGACQQGQVACPGGGCADSIELCGGTGSCPQGQVACPGSGICVMSIDECGGGTSCPQGQVMCPKGGCADTIENCAGSEPSCTPAQILCTSAAGGAQICATRCDDQSECQGGQDEDPFSCCDYLQGLMCPKGEGLVCVPAENVCANDGNQCDDGSDESVDTCCRRNDGLTCFDANNDQICVPKESVCAGDGAQCASGEDEDPNVCCHDSGGHLCSDKATCITPSQECDGTSDCPDGSDEAIASCGCPNEADFPCADGSQCLATAKKCDQTPDCTDGSDESLQTCGCPIQGELICKDGTTCAPTMEQCPSEPKP